MFKYNNSESSTISEMEECGILKLNQEMSLLSVA